MNETCHALISIFLIVMRYSVIVYRPLSEFGFYYYYMFFFYYVGQIVKASLGVICVSYNHEHILYVRSEGTAVYEIKS